MTISPWEDLAGTALPEGLVLTKLIEKTANSALFRAHAAEGMDKRETAVLLIRPLEPAQTVVNRFLEASFLADPGLARITSAGALETLGLVYALTEPVDHTLTQFVAQRPLPADDAFELTERLISALSYLHSENLVFCNLRPESVWRTGFEWKLGDFSQLRVIGRGGNRDLRIALARRPDLPPEVYEGVVSPAWDVWSLGLLLRRVLMPEPAHVEGSVSIPRARQLRNAELPAPFDTITRECLEPDVGARITLDGIRARLRPPVKAQTERPGPVVASSRPSTGGAVESAKERAIDFFRHLPDQRPLVQAGTALAGAAIIIGILATANALVRHRDVPPGTVAVAPVTDGTSDADRSGPAGPRRPVEPSSNPATASEPSTPAVDNAGLPDDIKALLDKWVSSTRSHDLRSNLDCYAPVVDSFYGRQGMTHDQLAREKQRQFDSLGRVRKYGVSNVRLKRIGADRAILSFDKEWYFGDRKPFAGAERAELTVRNVNGAWKITGEREVQVYWVKRGRQP